MSKTIPDFLKNFLEIQKILTDKEEKFKNKFKFILSDRISDEDKDIIYNEIYKIKDIQLCAYTDIEVQTSLIATNQQKCLKYNIKYPTQKDIKFDTKKVYYKLTDGNIDSKIEFFCDNDYKKSLSNNYIYKDTEIIYIYCNGESIFKYPTDKGIKNAVLNSKTGQPFIQPEDKNFDSFYYYLIEKKTNIDINLSKYIHFLIKLINYEDKPIEKNTSDLVSLYDKLKKGYEEFYTITPFVEAKNKKINELKEKYGKTKHFEFNFKSMSKIKPVNDQDIFDNLNIKLNSYNLYKNEIEIINEELNEFYNNSTLLIVDKLKKFVSIISKSNNLLEEIGPNDYKSNLLIMIVLKLPFYFLNTHDITEYRINEENKNLILNVYKSFSKWINICGKSNLINIYKYSYLLIINILLKQNYSLPMIPNDKVKQKLHILEEFMIDINSSVLVSAKLDVDINLIKSKLEQIEIWYWDDDSYQNILVKIYQLMLDEKKNTLEKEYSVNSKIKKMPEQVDLLTTKDLVLSNDVFNEHLNTHENKLINYTYFNKLILNESKEQGIINNAPTITIDESTLIFKFVNLESVDLNKEHNLLLIIIQMINICKLINLTESNFPYQLPQTTKCKLILDKSKGQEINKISYRAEFVIKEKTLENYYTPIANKLNTFGSETKIAYIDYFFNFITTSNTLYLNTIINPFVKYGYQLLDKDDVKYKPINYQDMDKANNKLSLNDLKSKQNFTELLDFVNKNLEEIYLDKLDKKNFNILFYVYTSIKSKNEIIEFINKYLTLCEKNLISKDEDIENSINKIDDKILKLIFITNGIKYNYLSGIEEKNQKIFYKLLDTITKLNTDNKIFNPIENKKNKYFIISNNVDKNFEYIEYSIPYLEITNENKIKRLDKNPSYFRKFKNQTFNKILKLDSSSYKKVDQTQFDNIMELTNIDYQIQILKKNFELTSDRTKLYPRQTQKITNKNFGLFIGNDGLSNLEDSVMKDDEYFDISNWRPKQEIEITLGQTIKINPNTPNYQSIFKYLLFLNKRNKNPNIKYDIKNSDLDKIYDISELEAEGIETFLPPLDPPPTNIKEVNFSNGYYEFKINEGKENNIYYQPPDMDIVLEYLEGTVIRFIVHNGTCARYYVNGTIRGQDIWMIDLYSSFVDLVQKSNPKIILTGIKFFDYDLTNQDDGEFDVSDYMKYIRQIRQTGQTGGIGEEYVDKNLSLFFNRNIKKLEVNLPEFIKLNDEQTDIIDTLEKTIILSTFNLLNSDKIYFDDTTDKIFSNKICDGNKVITIPVFPNIDFNQTIKRTYLSDKNINLDRKIYICGKDMFKLYNKKELVNLYNSSPCVINDSNKIIDMEKQCGENILMPIIYSNTKKQGEQITYGKISSVKYETNIETLYEINNFKQFEEKVNNIGWKYRFNTKLFKSIKKMCDINFDGLLDSTGNVQLSKPYFLDNPIFYDERYFIIKNQDGMITINPTDINLLYRDCELKIVDGLVKLSELSGTSDEKIYLSLFTVFETQTQPYHQSINNFWHKLTYAIPDNSNIITWVDSKTNQITNIDIIGLSIRFDVDEENIILSNRYKILLDYSGIDWRILRWVHYDYIDGELVDWIKDKRRIFLAKNKNDYYLIIFFNSTYIDIKIDSNTFLPILNKSEPLLFYYFIKFYDYNLDVINDLYPLVIKNNLDENIYGTKIKEFEKLRTKEAEKAQKAETEKKIVRSADSQLLTEQQNKILKENIQINKMISQYDEISFQCEHKINYYMEYDYINISKLNYQYYDDLFYQQFYFPDNKLTSFGDFMLFSLVNNKLESKVSVHNDIIQQINMSTLTFNLFYYKLITKIYNEFGIEDYMNDEQINSILEENNISILMPKHRSDGSKYFKLNPLEFYYQYIFGYFAHPTQLQMANEIFTDITGMEIKDMIEDKKVPINKTTSNNYRLNKFVQINLECFVEKKSNPHIHNLIMGGGKTSMITPLVIIKYLQYLTTKSADITTNSNCYIVLPEKLVNQSNDKLASLFNLYFPINLRKCIETRTNDSNINQEQKFNLTYLETLSDSTNSKIDKTNLNVFVMSDISLKSGFLNNYNLIIETNKNHIYLFDEVDTIINPITSELNYPLTNTTKSIENIAELFELFNKIYTNIYSYSSKSFNQILCEYPNNYTQYPSFTITNVSDNEFISKIKNWVRKTISKNLKTKGKQVIAKIIEFGFCSSESDYLKEIESLSLDELNMIYVINNYINVVFIPSLVMVNRVNYGTYFKSDEKQNNFDDNKNYQIDTNEIFSAEVFEKIQEYYTHIKTNIPKCAFEDIINDTKTYNTINSQLKTQINLDSQNTNNTDDLSKYLIIPFSNNEDPNIGSKFSNPIMTLCLTIINYIIRIGNSNIIDTNGIKQIAKIIYDEYMNGDKSYVDVVKEIFGTKFKISDILDEWKNFTPEQIVKIKSNKYLMYKFCKKVCVDSIKVDMIRFNVSGIDLMESSNIPNRSGFSGTVGIPQPIDTSYKSQLEINRDSDTIGDIRNVLETKCTIRVYNSKSNLLDQMIQIIQSNININTIIDCGGVFVNQTPKQIWNKLKEIGKINGNTYGNAHGMYFWNNDDRPQEFILTKSNPTNATLPDTYKPLDTENKIFYYYDQKHTTGIDAKIPLGSVGLVFLNKSSRYRDVVQSIYRMRKLSLSQSQSHRIIFCLADDIALNIGLSETGDIDKLLNWFNSNEDKYFTQQQISANIQNTNTISRIIKSSEPKYSKSNNKSCVFLSHNYFRELVTKDYEGNKEIIEGTTNWIELELGACINVIRPKISKLNKDIEKLISNVEQQIKHSSIINEITAQSQSVSQSTSISTTQTQTQTQTQNFDLESIRNERNYKISTIEVVNFNIQDYFKWANTKYFTNISNEVLYLSTNALLYSQELFPSTIIYLPSDNKILLIPNMEGFKVIDWLKNTSVNSIGNGLPNTYLILDSTGTVYLNKNIDKNQVQLVQSYSRIMLSIETDRTIISPQDIVNFKLFVSSLNSNNKSNIKKHLATSPKEQIKKLLEEI